MVIADFHVGLQVCLPDAISTVGYRLSQQHRHFPAGFYMSLAGPRATHDVLCLASGFQAPPKLLGKLRPLPRLFGDLLPREG